MNRYNPNIHHRRSIRLKGYDYSQAGLYFITLCVQNRKSIFGRIENGKMIHNELGKIAYEEWLNTSEIRKNISLGEFIIMPNHFHAIIQIDCKINPEGVLQLENKNLGNNRDNGTGVLQYAPTKFKSPSNNIGAIIRGYKGATTTKIKEIIRNNNTGVLQLENENSGNNRDDGTGVLQYAPTKSIWQRNYWEHIIRNEKEYNRIAQYIIDNPVKWANDKLNGENGNIVMEPSADYNFETWMV